MKKVVEQLDFTIKYLFILTSILGMSSILYSYISPFYKLITIALLGVEAITVLANRKEIKRLYDLKAIVLVFGVILANIVAALVNYRFHLVGNMIEVIFMVAYCYISFLYHPKTMERLMKSVMVTVQFFAFLVSVAGIFFLLSRTIVIFDFNRATYYYGFYHGRLWGVLNPNTSAVLAFTSILMGVLRLIKGTTHKKLIKANIILQFIYFMLQQSRGALLSAIVVLACYMIFIKKGTVKSKCMAFVVAATLMVASNVVINTVAIQYVHIFKTTIVGDVKKKEIDLLDLLKEQDDQIRISENTSSGRLHIWQNGIRMGLDRPFFGFGVRNILPHYSFYFKKYVIDNSLKGGSFHNIFITVFVASGFLGFAAFLSVMLYSTYRWIKYLLEKKSLYTKVVILMTGGLLFGQLFESQILYSTNYINIIFWTLLGYSFYLMKQDEHTFYEKIETTEELQQIELGIMDYIHEVCVKIDAKYMLAYGTLLGAVRHQGFIPWDDDLDLCMLRNDYEKLQDYLIAHPHEQYEVQSYKNNPNYVYPFMKVIDKTTYLIEDDVRIDSHMGVYVDIFPIDAYEEDSAFRDKMTLIIKKRQLSSYTFSGIINTKSKFDTFVRYCFVALFAACDTTSYIRQIDDLAKSRKVEDSPYANYLIYKDMNRPLIRKECFQELMTLSFCGREYFAPKHYHEILTSDYGEYMVLPPVEQQKTHHNFTAWRIKHYE